MKGFTESLTLQIIADGSQFHAELDRALGRLQAVSQQMSELERSQSGIGRLGNAFRQLSSPLTQTSSLVTRVTSQVRQLSGLSVSLNVAPALQALGQLSAAAQRVAAQLQSLSGMGGSLGGRVASATAGGSSVGSPRRMQSGGLVTGPAGIDRVPAWLSAGEFVLQRSAVEQWGSSFLESMNQGRAQARSREVAPQERQSVSNVTQYGEISIHVHQPVALGDLMRDLQFEGHRLRNRRG